MFAYCWNNPVNMYDGDGNWPSWNDIKNGACNTIDYVKNKVAPIAGSAMGALAEIKRKAQAFINDGGFVQFLPKGSIAKYVKPLGKLAKYSTALTILITGSEIASTFADSKLTLKQKFEKSGIQAGIAALGYLEGTISVGVVSACVMGEAPTLGSSTVGVVLIVGADYEAGVALDKLESYSYEQLQLN